MKVIDLMGDLQKLYPEAFGKQEKLQAWARQYAVTLGNHEGDKLATAWSRTMAGWEKSSFPKPSEILRNLPEPTAEQRASAKAQKLAKEREDRVAAFRNSQLWRTACSEGWARSALIHLRRGTLEVVDDVEAAKLRRFRREFEACKGGLDAKIRDGKASPIEKALAGMAAIMSKDAEKLRRA